MLLHDVIVVEQPLGRGACIHVVSGRREQSLLRVGEDPSRLGQTSQQARWTQRRAARDKPLIARHRTCARREVICAQQFTTDRTRQQFVGRFRSRALRASTHVRIRSGAVISGSSVCAHQTARLKNNGRCRNGGVHELSLEELGSPRRLRRTLLRRAEFGHPR